MAELTAQECPQERELVTLPSLLRFPHIGSPTLPQMIKISLVLSQQGPDCGTERQTLMKKSIWQASLPGPANLNGSVNKYFLGKSDQPI